MIHHISADVVPNLLNRVATYFSLGVVHTYEQLGGFGNQNFKVEADSGVYVVKILLEIMPEHNPLKHEYIKRLKEHHFPIPTYIHSPKDTTTYRDEETNTYIEVLEYIPGTHEENTQEFAEVCGALLGKLHTIPHEGLTPLPTWQDFSYIPDALTKTAHSFPQETNRMKEIFDTLTHLSTCELPLAIAHGNTSQENIVLKTDGARVVIDWGDVSLLPRVINLAMGAIFLSIPEGSTTLDETYIRAYIRAYIRHIQLTPQERDLLKDALRYAALTRTVFRLTRAGVEYPDGNEELLKNWDFYWQSGVENIRV